jgi:hypothetical protein
MFKEFSRKNNFFAFAFNPLSMDSNKTLYTVLTNADLTVGF